MQYVLLPCIICVILFLCFSGLLANSLQLPLLGKRDLILVLFVRLFDLRLFGFVWFLYLLVSEKAAACDCGTPWTFLLPFLLVAVSCTRHNKHLLTYYFCSVLTYLIIYDCIFTEHYVGVTCYWYSNH